MSAVRLEQVEDAVAAIATGAPVVVVDDADRENEGDLIFAASMATERLLAFAVRHSSGIICVPMTRQRLAALDLPPMTAVNADPHRTAFAVSADARTGVTTGISAADRAHTIRLLADPATTPGDLVRPGHVFPLAARPGGVLERPGHTEAATDLVTLAGLLPVGALVELVNDDGTMMRAPALRAFADEYGLAMISIADLATYRRQQAAALERVARTRLPLSAGTFETYGYRSPGGDEHLALVHGDVHEAADVLVRVHSECLTGEALGSGRCDCGPQLAQALTEVAAAGAGVVVYLRGHEGRGIGLVEKLRAYALQDAGLDTVDANLRLGHPVDGRTYEAAGQILRDLGVRSVRLLTNNPDKVTGLTAAGIDVRTRLPLVVSATPDSVAYLATKRERLGHLS